jgi:hypothetical protein
MIIREIFRSVITNLIKIGDIIKLTETKDFDALHDQREKIKKEKDGKRS